MTASFGALRESLAQFRAEFADEETCATYLFNARWPDGFVCPDCKATRYTPLKSRPHIYECLHCGHQTSITAGTVMHGTHLPLRYWFWAAHLIATHPDALSAQRLKVLLDVTYKTAWALKQKMPRPLDSEPLGGRVEVGHSKIGFRGADILLDPTGSGIITIAAAISSLEIRLAAIPDNSVSSVEAFIRSNVKPGSTLLPDSSYPHFVGYKRAARRLEEVPQLSITFELLRRCRYRGESVEAYLRKFVASHNNLHRKVSFDTVLKAALHGEPDGY